jgi:sugar phosphate permease
MDIARPLDDAEVGLGQPTNVRWRIVALLFGYSFMSWFNRLSLQVAYVEQIRREQGIAEHEIGAINSAFFLAYTVFMTPGGWLADRIGPKRALVMMGIGSGVFAGLTGLPGLLVLSAGQTLFALFVVRALMGVFTAPIYPASSRLIAQWIPFSQRAMVNGFLMGAALVGNAFCFHGFGALLDRMPWGQAFLITGSITVLVGILWTTYACDDPEQHPSVNQAEQAWIRHEKVPRAATSGVVEQVRTHDDHAHGRSSWLTLLRNRSLIFLTLSYAAVGYFEYMFYYWTQYYLVKIKGVGIEDSRSYATITALATAAGMGLGGVFSDWLQRRVGYRWGRALVPIGCLLAAAALLFASINAEQVGWIVLWLALANAAVGATEGPFWATAIELGGRRGATAAGILNTGGNAGGTPAPTLTPLISDAWGWQWGIGVGSIVCLAGVVFWFWIDPAERTEAEP